MDMLKYGLEDKIPTKENLLYVCQHIIFFLASAVVMPVVVGYALGLQQVEVADMLQRTLVLCGGVSIIQVIFGHGYPIMDGPAGLWSGLMILMAGIVFSFGQDLPGLRADLQVGMMTGGAVVLILSLTGIVVSMLKLFTPLINGVIILLMVLQISPSIVKGMAGITDDNKSFDLTSTVVFLFTMMIILLINNYAKGFIRSIATFIGAIAGWILAALLGVTEHAESMSAKFVTLPKPFAWGVPEFDAGIIVTCVIASLALVSMVFASINGMAETLDDEIPQGRMKKAIGIHGFAAILAGIFPTIAFMPYVSSTGVVKMTGIASRSPFIIASVIMIIMGLIAPIGMFFSTIPIPVGYAALIMVFALILGQGLNEFKKVSANNREHFIIGISVLVGTGIMFLSSETFQTMPPIMGCLLSNGLIDGMIIAMLLEHVVLRKK